MNASAQAFPSPCATKNNVRKDARRNEFEEVARRGPLRAVFNSQDIGTSRWQLRDEIYVGTRLTKLQLTSSNQYWAPR
jgi:hypothetical protein